MSVRARVLRTYEERMESCQCQAIETKNVFITLFATFSKLPISCESSMLVKHFDSTVSTADDPYDINSLFFNALLLYRFARKIYRFTYENTQRISNQYHQK